MSGIEWVTCPLCEGEDNRKEDGIIICTNQLCPSNIGYTDQTFPTNRTSELEVVARALCSQQWEDVDKISGGEPCWWKFTETAKLAIKAINEHRESR